MTIDEGFGFAVIRRRAGIDDIQHCLFPLHNTEEGNRHGKPYNAHHQNQYKSKHREHTAVVLPRGNTRACYLAIACIVKQSEVGQEGKHRLGGKENQRENADHFDLFKHFGLFFRTAEIFQAYEKV